jgi:sarcosine oxidase subunit alpha
MNFRLAQGGRIDRDAPLSFTFDGRVYRGFAGDTLASALLANGQHLFGRSFKYHRPRGLLAAGAEEPNALVGVGADEAHYTPNLRATQVELYDGLVAQSQNRYPSLRFDIGAINDLASPLLPAGFYYKTFMWPAKAWTRFYEPNIRAAAGLGRAPRAPDADIYANIYAHCDVLVIGSGPAGLSAALTASETGARVILCDEQAEFGGSLLAETTATIDGLTPSAWLGLALATLKAHNVTLLARATAFGYFPHNLIGIAERVTHHLAAAPADAPRERLWQVRAKQVVLATGAHERPLVFPGNDRPGVMLADAAREFANRYAVRPGTTAVVFTAHDAAYGAALDLARAGLSIAAIADLRPDARGTLPNLARAAGLRVLTGTTVTQTKGRLRLSAVTLQSNDGSAPETRRCDLLLMSGGFTPSVHLFSQSLGKLRFDDALQSFIPDIAAEATLCAGACRGAFGIATALQDGAEKGAEAAQKCGFTPLPAPGHNVSEATYDHTAYAGATPRPGRGKAFVDFQNDVTAKDIGLAVQEGFTSIEHIKRYTTTGMATDQGKTSNMNALAIAAAKLQKPIAEIGLTTFRAPYTPVSFGVLAGASRGALFDPVRTTPFHDWSVSHGAVFEDVGLWKRARYFPQPGESMHQAVARECLAVRNTAGIFDASTLGKIEIVGPDAAEFMNRMYTNSWTKLEPGRLRYGVMLREDGFVLDDGVIGRLAKDRFHVTTTTGGAPRVLAMMEDYLQTEWPNLHVWLTSTTDQWAVIALQGPNARKILAPLLDDIDISPDAMPHMSLRTGHIGGIKTRLFRVSFTGELGYEINLPAGSAAPIWAKLVEAGSAHGLVPYGTETMHVLRAEKGYIIVGQETDGTATPDDAGLGWAIGRAKTDFVGKRSLTRPALAAPGRKQLVGLLTEDPRAVLKEGAQIVADPAQKIPMTIIGHVTSSYHSATLGHSIALAMVADGRAKMGQTLFVPMPDRTLPVRVVSSVFYDPDGERLNA